MSVSAGLEEITRRIEAATALDFAGNRLRALGRLALKHDSTRDLLSGRPIGHPLHPALVMVPAGAFLSATALDLTGGTTMRPASRRLIGLGLLTAVPTALAGWADWLDTEDAESRTGVVHAAMNVTALYAYYRSWRARHRGKRGLGSALLGATALGAGGWLGGHLSFGEGVGVDTTAFQAGPTDWREIAADTDITDDLRQVDVDGLQLLLTRVDGTIVAIADRCTHRGGPLSEGSREGDCVACPWHGSSFSLRSGAVLRGPASRPQPAYEARVEAGRVQVRRPEPRSLRRNPVGA